ncbi:hypothetical protein L1765_09215 [Microaerobacter geothermalis]|uniref:hypothetical protein n=1 Tax=Microaerobacter geothermalis TaxID=674972 RepID=UPI001F20CBD4|nr:hypothetical protein [Microaerobacter geothermalis]MCF6094141.1 hypothetical protein [Microaerobacter geothermalis]
MATRQQIQQCITDCTNAANMLRSATNTVPKAAIRDMLTQGAHHIETCIRQCEQASMQVQ